MDNNHEVIYDAKFHPVLKTYLLVYTALILLVTIAGIVLIPFWLLGIGMYFCGRYYESLECIVTTQTLEIKKGWLFRVEKTIPLDKIQDLTLKEGPILRALKINQIEIETAGQANPQGGSDAKLIGIVDPRKFREKVLSQKDKIIGKQEPGISFSTDKSDENVLVQIRDSIKNIEGYIKDYKKV